MFAKSGNRDTNRFPVAAGSGPKRIRRRTTVAAALVALVVHSAAIGPLFGREPFLEFVHALQREGYGELSIQYLESWKKRTDVPPEALEVFDLEMAMSLQAAAKETTNTDLAQKRLEQAEQLLEKFSKDHPDHPGLAKSVVAAAQKILERGNAALAAAQSAPNEETKIKGFEDARAAFQEARPKLVSARKGCDKVINNPKNKKSDVKIEAEINWIDASLKMASGDYSLSQTYREKKDKNRIAALKRAGETFEEVYTRYPHLPIGRRAHMYYGKMQAESGDRDGALDTFEEVLTGDTEPAKVSPEMAGIYIQAQIFQFDVVLEKDGPNEVLKQLAEWEKDHAVWKKFPEFQGIFLATAKAQLAKAEKSGKDDAAKLRNDAAKTIAAVAKVESPFQAEAKQLNRVATGSSGGGTNFDDLLFDGDTKGSAGNWDAAREPYAKALQLAEAAANPKQIADVKQRLNWASFQLARGAFVAKRYEEALKSAEKIATQFPEDPAAPNASSLALYCAGALFDTASDSGKEEAFQTVKRLADLIVQKWPEKPEADDARNVLARVLIARGDAAAGLALLREIPSGSRHFPSAVQTIGQAYLRMYRDEKKKPEAQRNADQLTKSRGLAVENLGKSLELQKKSLAAGEPMPKQIADLQYMLGSLALEGKDAKTAQSLLDPLVNDWERNNKSSKKEMDDDAQRLFVATIRAHVENGESAAAGRLVEILVKNGTDAPNSNAALVEFAKLVDADRKKTEEDLAHMTDPTAKKAARDRLTAANNLLRNAIDQLCKRENHSIGGLVWLADAATNVGLTRNATEIYGKILERSKKEPEFAKVAEKYLDQVRAKQIKVLINENQFAEAIQQIDDLIQKKPNSIEPMLIRAEIMQSWATKEEKQYAAAASAWGRAREMLGRLPKKPPEYFDAVYNTAVCLMGDFKFSKKKKSAQDAEKVLRSTLTSYPELSGPEAVAKYNELLVRVLTALDKDPKEILNKESVNKDKGISKDDDKAKDTAKTKEKTAP